MKNMERKSKKQRKIDRSLGKKQRNDDAIGITDYIKSLSQENNSLSPLTQFVAGLTYSKYFGIPLLLFTLLMFALGVSLNLAAHIWLKDWTDSFGSVSNHSVNASLSTTTQTMTTTTTVEPLIVSSELPFDDVWTELEEEDEDMGSANKTRAEDRYFLKIYAVLGVSQGESGVFGVLRVVQR